MKDYMTGRSMFNIIWCADNVILIAVNENDQYRLLFQFSKACRKYNMKQRTRKQMIIISLKSIWSRLMTNDKQTEQVNKMIIWNQDSKVLVDKL